MTSGVKASAALARDVQVTDDALTVNLQDGRSVAVPLGWYPFTRYSRERHRPLVGGREGGRGTG